MKNTSYEKEAIHSYIKNQNIFLIYKYLEDGYYGELFHRWFRYSNPIITPNQETVNFYNAPSKVHQELRKKQLKNSTITVVLIGSNTWRDYHIDWLINSSLTHSEHHPASKVLGLLLPTHPDYYKTRYSPHLIPPRLYDNLNNGVSILRQWSDSQEDTMRLVHTIMSKTASTAPVISRPLRQSHFETSGWVE